MALKLLASLHICKFNRPPPIPSKGPISLVKSRSGIVVQCMPASKISNSPTTLRRSANYQPTDWHNNYIQSLRNDYTGESCTRQNNMLKEQVRMMLHKVVDPIEQLELIDILQRLGISYHFEGEIKRILEGLYNNIDHGSDIDTWKTKNLYAIALKFRLLRQHGYIVSQVFNSFMDERGNFKACLCEDTKGMLSLYEASFLSIENENILEDAREFSTKHLKVYVKKNKDKNLSALVSHSLKVPLHWRMLRLEARWFIDIYRRREDMNTILLELAELDFNMVQATHQEDLKELSRSWKSTGLVENLNFVRDRPMECLLWTMGLMFQPQFGYFRRTIAKFGALITVIDDIYDVYGTLDELECFTNAVQRWDINAMDGLPEYMKLCFFALHNSVNELAFDILKEQRFNIIRYLKKVWADLCRTYLLEAKWYHNGYTPSLQEYIENAWISVAGPNLMVQAYFCVTNPLTSEALDCLEEYPNMIRWSSLILRLADDLGTSTDEIKRGDVPKAIQCYMNETGASEEDAREYIRCMISATWKKMNEVQVASSPFSQTYIDISFNVARMAQFMYQHGDGHGAGNQETKGHILSLLIQPIPVNKNRCD
ncbi:myrcene synthase, chloroplastic-like isoform X2 [Quercus lobata]|uniref:myrcene synthase, chloroplastic-like isoform X2 n=1 Tax=Quercus lobata TaxID=97700 RepID=UPI001244B8BE|nr:myrcene synthase, chloroplastic-like isoform X2 [Quercus lobata]